MDEKDIERIAEAVKAVLTPLVESLKPEAPVEEEVAEPDMAAVTESALEAGLTKSARARVAAAVKAGVEVEEAIKAEKDLKAEILAEAETASAEGRVITGSGESRTDKLNTLFGGN